MRVLVCHSRYRSGPSSGENRVVEDEVRLLREAGHEVEVFAPEPGIGGADQVRSALSAVWSRAASRRVRAARADVVHVHNMFPTLSPAVLRAARASGAGVVMTLHNFRAMCLPATLLRDGKVCTDCVGRVPWRGVVRRCYRDSLAGSAVLAGSLTLHRAIDSFDAVGVFLAVSGFVRDKHVEAGLNGERIRVKPNFTWEVPASSPRTHLLSLGRVSPEKGVDVLMRAWLPSHGRLVVAGDGPAMPLVRSLAPEGVEFEGAVPAERAGALMAGARALIVPSVWYEGAPRVIAEAYACGVPVIASDIGGLSEAVIDGETGFLVPPGDPDALRAAILAMDESTAERLGRGAREFWSRHYSPARAVEHLTSAYADAVAVARR